MSIFEEDLPDVLADRPEVDKDDPIIEELKSQYSFISDLEGKYVLYRDPEDENLLKAYFCRRWLWCYQPGCARAAKYDKNKAICVGFMNLEQAACRMACSAGSVPGMSSLSTYPGRHLAPAVPARRTLVSATAGIAPR